MADLEINLLWTGRLSGPPCSMKAMKLILIPKLLMTVEPAVGLGSAEVIAWAAATFADLEVESVGRGSHHAPEDQPVAIAKSVAGWLDRHGLLA